MDSWCLSGFAIWGAVLSFSGTMGKPNQKTFKQIPLTIVGPRGPWSTSFTGSGLGPLSTVAKKAWKASFQSNPSPTNTNAQIMYVFWNDTSVISYQNSWSPTGGPPPSSLGKAGRTSFTGSGLRKPRRLYLLGMINPSALYQIPFLAGPSAMRCKLFTDKYKCLNHVCLLKWLDWGNRANYFYEPLFRIRKTAK